MPQSEDIVTKKIHSSIKQKLDESGHALLIVDRNCPICKDVAKKFINDSRIVICPLEDPSCFEIAKSARIQGVPRLIFRDRDSKGMKICKLSEDGLICAPSERELRRD